MTKFRLNFYIKNRDVKKSLDQYLKNSGRTQADVVLQLINEVIDGSRVPQEIPKPKMRTNVSINLDVVNKFRDKLKDLGAPVEFDARDVVPGLLEEFLEEKGAAVFDKLQSSSGVIDG